MKKEQVKDQQDYSHKGVWQQVCKKLKSQKKMMKFSSKKYAMISFLILLYSTHLLLVFMEVVYFIK